MSLPKTVVSRPTTFFIIFVLLLGLSGFAFMNLSIDLMPDINFPYLIVSTTYSGAGPEEVERTISRPLESALVSVTGLKKISSTSNKGSSMVMMEFNYGTDLADAANSVRDGLDRVKRYLPTDADPPAIFRFDPSMIPIISLTVSSENRSPEDIRQLAKDMIVPRLEQIDGVATANINGGRDKQVRIEIDASRLEAYGLTVTQLQSMLAAQNMQVSAGTITEGSLSYILTTMGEYTDLDQIRNTVVSYSGGGLVNGKFEQPVSVFIRDLANVFWGYKDQESSVYVNDEESIRLRIQKQSGKNSVQVAKSVRKRIEQLEKELPQDIRLTETDNSTDEIEKSINNVASTAIGGAFLAVFILFIFLRSIKPTIIIGVSIPISILITLMLMYFFGLTLNLMTLAGLFLGVGMLVDNSIVILENIYHYREKGAKLEPAAILGTQEMIVAITCSTLTTICVFLPMVLFQSILGIAGEMFAGLAFTVVFSLSISLFVALFLVPILSSRYMPLVTRKQVPLTGKLAAIDNVFENMFKKLENSYRNAVGWVLRHKLLTIGVIFILFVVSVLSVLKIGYVFMPEDAADSVTLSITLPLGTPLKETEQTVKQVEAIAKSVLTPNGIPAYNRIIMSAGGGGIFSTSGANSGSLRFNLPDFKDQTMNANEVKAAMRPFFNQFPGVRFNFSEGNMGMGGANNPIDIVLRTDDLEKGKAMAEKIAELIRVRLPAITEPTVSLDDGLPQFEIILNRDRMYALGLNAATVGAEIKAAVDGLTASKFKEAGNDYDIVLIFKEADRNSRPALEQIFVKSVTGQRIPLSNFASYRDGTGPMTISRENQSRVIHINAGVVPGTALNAITDEVRALINSEIPAESDVVILYEGDNAEMMKMMINFVLIMIVAIALVFGVMASLFESFKDPFIIIFTIPLSFIGIVAIYAITGDKFNILTVVGLLVLMGTIVNNGIVLVDYTNLLRKRGYNLHDACIEAAGNRLRPILMSTLTTVLGLAPMAFVPGDGSEMVGPIGKTVFGGLTFGTIMTLFLMPSIYAFMNKNDERNKARAAARREGIAAGLKGRQLKQNTAGGVK